MRPTDFMAKPFINELIRLARLDRNWIEIEMLNDNEYRARFKQRTPLIALCKHGGEGFGMLVTSLWLVDGPKVFIPTPAQCEALEHVEVNLKIEEYSQPYPALAVQLPPDRYGPYKLVIVGHNPQQQYLCATLHTMKYVDKDGSSDDITTTVKSDGKMIEESLARFDPDCQHHGSVAHLALRVAVNSCLALVHYGCHDQYLFPKEAENDRRLARENSERGERAQGRLRMASREIILDRTVRLHQTEGSRDVAEPTGREMSFHWRRGHWAMQTHGPGNSLRKRIFRLPVMVRADLLTGDVTERTTTYKS